MNYVVTRDVGSGVHFTVYDGADPKFVDTGLLAGETYLYKVRAVNA